jgi:REP element-mobilizing transposase RayT
VLEHADWLDEPRREVVLRTIQEVAKHRGWKLWAVHVRSNHVHLVVTASPKPEKVMSDIKAWASRRLREAFGAEADRDRWTQHGSTRWLNDKPSLAASVTYVLDGQGEVMAQYDGQTNDSNEPEAEATRHRGRCRCSRFRFVLSLEKLECKRSIFP